MGTEMPLRSRGVALVLCIALGAMEVHAQTGAKPAVYGDEARDWNVRPTSRLRTTDYHAPTPLSIPGGRMVTTEELKAMRSAQPAPYLIDVLGGNVHRTIGGAFWMIGAGAGDFNREEEKRFATALAGFAAGDKGRPLVFFCVDAECWLSYNAALRAIALGYTNVMWYRGGISSWRISGGSMAQSDPFFW